MSAHTRRCDVPRRRAVWVARPVAALAILLVSVIPVNALAAGDVVPGRIIVKFRDSLTASATDLVANRQPFSSALTDGSDSLDQLNQALGITAADAVFVSQRGMSPSETRAVLQSAFDTAKTRFPQRTARIPPDAPPPPDLTNIYTLSYPAGIDPHIVCNRYRTDPHVAWCQPDYIVSTDFVPNDPYFQSSGSWDQSYRDLWGLKSVNAKSAWDGTQGEGIVVAVVDSGLDLTHPDIAANVWSNPGEVANGIDDDSNGHIDDLHGWDFIQDDAVPQDELGHGTHVAGTIAAVGNNSLGIIGIAPRAQIMPVRVFDGAGNTSSDGTLAAGILYAVLSGADVINNSLGV